MGNCSELLWFAVTFRWANVSITRPFPFLLGFMHIQDQTSCSWEITGSYFNRFSTSIHNVW